MAIGYVGVFLGSSVVGAIVTSYFNKRRGDKTERLKYVTEERQMWRKDIRAKTVKLIANQTTENIIETKAFFEVRLNPYDPEDNKLLECLKNVKEDPDKFSNAVAILLKHDWERVKDETTSQIRPYFATVIIVVVSILYRIFYHQMLGNYSETIRHSINEIINRRLFGVLIVVSIAPYLLKLYKMILGFNSLNRQPDLIIKSWHGLFDLPYRRAIEE